MSSKVFFSPLLTVLQKQIVPWVQQTGVENIITATSSLKAFQEMNPEMPSGAYVVHKPLRSRRQPVKGSKGSVGNEALLDARWPADGLHSTRGPILCFIVTGPVAIPLGDYVLHCLPGHGIIIPPGTPHPDGSHHCLDESRPNQQECDMFSMLAWGGGVDCWLSRTRKHEHWSHRGLGEHCHVLHAQARLYLETLAEEAVGRAPHYQTLSHGLLLALVTILTREIQEARALESGLKSGKTLAPVAPLRYEQEPIARAQTYIRNHLDKPLSIDLLANHAHMSRSYFTRQFRKTVGESCTEYVTRCRLEKAQVLLRDTEWSIDKISAFVGVTSTRLRLLFREHENLSPGDFRRNIRLEHRQGLK